MFADRLLFLLASHTFLTLHVAEFSTFSFNLKVIGNAFIMLNWR